MSLFCHMCESKTDEVTIGDIKIEEPNMPARKIKCLLCQNCVFSLQFSANAVKTNQKFIDECYKKIEKNKNK